MTKRRTKKQKVHAHRSTINWEDLRLEDTSKSKLTEADVNRQNHTTKSDFTTNKLNKKNPDYKEKVENLASIRTGLVKSILISISIIIIEIVLYLFWV